MQFDLKNQTQQIPTDNHAGGDPRIVFIVKLGQALHRYGVPAHRLEQGLNLVAQRFGMAGNFFVTPTGIFASFGLPEEYRTSLIRIESTEVNLEKQAQLDELVTRVIRGQVSLAEGTQAIDRIVAARRSNDRTGRITGVDALARVVDCAADVHGAVQCAPAR